MRFEHEPLCSKPLPGFEIFILVIMISQLFSLMCQGMSNANDNKIVHQNLVQNDTANNASRFSRPKPIHTDQLPE